MPLTKRLIDVSLLLSAALLAGCGGGGGGGEAGNFTMTEPASASYEAAGYSVTILGASGGDCYAVALNDAGDVVGNCLNGNGGTDAVLWSNSNVSVLATSAQASSINNHGEVAGWLDTPAGSRAFLHQGFITQLDYSDRNARALAINDAGTIAGRWSSDKERAFVEKRGTMEEIAPELNAYAVAMNNAGQVVLKEVRPDSFRAHLWKDGVLTDLGSLGGKFTQGQDINSKGQVVGWGETPVGRYHAFIWENGRMTSLARTIDEHSSAVAVNDHGQVLIRAATATANQNLLWENGVYTDLGHFGSAFAEVTAVNNHGQIVGWLFTDTGKIRAFLATPRGL